MYNNEQKEAIIEYGINKYNNGYIAGYASGIVTGSLITILGFLAANILQYKTKLL